MVIKLRRGVCGWEQWWVMILKDKGVGVRHAVILAWWVITLIRGWHPNHCKIQHHQPTLNFLNIMTRSFIMMPTTDSTVLNECLISQLTYSILTDKSNTVAVLINADWRGFTAGNITTPISFARSCLLLHSTVVNCNCSGHYQELVLGVAASQCSADLRLCSTDPVFSEYSCFWSENCCAVTAPLRKIPRSACKETRKKHDKKPGWTQGSGMFPG
jgi:hypothetical protein